jgi:tetratricopeptide (TPR) repeat protein
MRHNLTREGYLRGLFALVALLCLLGATCASAQNASKPARSALEIVRTLLARGDLDGAEKSLWAKLSSNPNDEQALTLLGIVRGRQKRYAEAESLFRRVLQLNPRSAEGSRNLAKALAAQDKLEEAGEQYQHATKLAPRDFDLKVELARLDLGRGSFAAALSTLESIPQAQFPAAGVPIKAASLLGLGQKSQATALVMTAKDSPAMAMDLAEVFLTAKLPDEALRTLNLAHLALKLSPARFYYLQGQAMRAKGENPQALNSFRRALTFDPKSIDSTLAVAEILASQGNHSESLSMLQRARSLDPDALTILRHVVVEAMTAEQHRTALQAALELQQKSSDNLDDKYLVAAVMLQERESQSATHILEAYVAQRPGDSRAFLGLGLAYLNQQQYSDARKALERSLQLEPGSAETEYQLGVVATKQGNTQEAIQKLEHAVEIQPDHAKALLHLGTLYLQSGDLGRAETMLQRSIVSDPTDPDAEYHLSLLFSRLDKPAEARQHMERFSRLKAEAEYQIGIASRTDGKAEEAMGRFEHAVQLDPQHSKALLSLGMLYLEAGDLEKARSMLQSAETADPSNPETQHQLSLLFSRLGMPEESRKHVERLRKLKGKQTQGRKSTAAAQVKAD